MPTPKSTRSIRAFHSTVILEALHRCGSCSRAELSRVTKLSPSTVTRIVNQLIHLGIVYEDREGESTGGRKPVMIRINYRHMFAVGVQIHRSQIAIALGDLRGTLHHEKTYRPWSLDPPFLLQELSREINNLIDESGIDRDNKLLGVGMAIAGVVDSQSGTMLQSINLGWRNVPITEPLQRYLQLPVFVENDANAGALAETWLGAPPSVQNLLYLKTDAGVGASLIVGGQLVTGPRGMAGEIGHIPLMRCGYRCRCGQRDCLETYVYVPDVLSRYESMTGQAIDEATFFDMKQSDDPVLRQLKAEAEQALTLALSFAIALLDLDAVIIGGRWGRDTETTTRIQTACQNHAMRTGLNKPITVKGASAHGDSDLVGAVGLVINRFLSPAWAVTNGHMPSADP